MSQEDLVSLLQKNMEISISIAENDDKEEVLEIVIKYQGIDICKDELNVSLLSSYITN